MCQRYYTKFSGTIYGGRYGSSASMTGGTLPTTMRSTPSLSYSDVRTTTGLNAYATPEKAQYIMTHASGYVSNLECDAEL